MSDVCPIWKAIIQNVRYEPHPWDNAREGTLTGVDAAVREIRVMQAAERRAADGAYLIWSNEHRCWWAPNRCGYTTSIDRAGRYERAEALSIAGTARGGWQAGRNASEIAIPEADAIEQSQHPDRLEAWRDAQAAQSEQSA